jgi:4-amino-4-deoxy-L-arabinose transferase-like glycosyltransferase
MPDDLTSTLAAPEVEADDSPLRERAAWSARAVKRMEAGLLLIAAIFYALHFVHLRADFPNHSPWMDWAKYTDEGWYGDAATRHYQLGHWYLPGDFNAAVALPVWPLLELALFRVTGVSLAAARALTVAVFGLTLLCCYGLVRMWSGSRAGATRDCDAVAATGAPTTSLAPAIAVLLLAVSPFCFAFMRLAILEPLMVLLTLAAMLAASVAGRASAEGCRDTTRWRLSSDATKWAVALGLLLPAMVLAKTTAVFLFPAIFWLVWAASGHRVRPALRVVAVACGVGAAVWGTYYGLFVRPRYLLDYRYLFSANAYTGITRATLWPVVRDTITDVGWIGETLFVLAMIAIVASLLWRRLRGNPLVVALLLWIFGYGAFLAYHANLQPRYYVVLAVPLTMLVGIAFDAVLACALAGWADGWAGSRAGAWALRLAAGASGVALVAAAVLGARQTIGYALHPEYTWVDAAAQVAAAVRRGEVAEPTHSPLLLSISGADLSLMTELASICDDFGTMTLPDRVAAYRPGWFATWNDVEDDKMEALAPMYRLVRVMSVAAFDDPERNLLVLYRLDPVGVPGPPGRPGRRRSLSVPRRLRTKVGEQPTVQQLKH